MSTMAPAETDREQTLGTIIAAYNEVTDRLKQAHERLAHEVRRLREDLEQKNAELRRRERLAALGEMAAGLAHEVRNPLGGIALHAAMLEQDLADRPAALGLARRIREGVRALDRLVTDVLTFAQDGVLSRAPADVAAVLDGAVRQCGLTIGEAGPRLEMHSAGRALVADIDASRLERALVNLIANAIAAAGPGGQVTCGVRAAAGGVEVWVRDDGPGIAQQDLERMFHPFYTTRANGTGLGLPIVHRIVEGHGGRIRVTSAVGRGAEFVVWLPARGSGESEGSAARVTAARPGRGG